MVMEIAKNKVSPNVSMLLEFCFLNQINIETDWIWAFLIAESDIVEEGVCDL